MSEDQLRDLMHDLAEPVPPPQLAAVTWQASRRIRRNRYRAAAGMLAVASVTALILLPGRGSAPPVARPLGTVSPPGTSVAGLTLTKARNGGTDFDLAPKHEAEAELPVLRTALPARLPGPPRDAPDLTADPITGRALLLASTGSGTVYAFGDDGHYRRVDAGLRPITDQGGNAASALSSTSLNPAGTEAAFAQKNEIVIVALATGAAVRRPVPGFNEQIVWHGDELVVHQTTGSVTSPVAAYTVPVSGAARPASWLGTAAASVPGDRPLVVDTGTATSRWTGETKVGEIVTSPSNENAWGMPFVNGDRMARSSASLPGPDGMTSGEGVNITDLTTGRTTRALWFDITDRWKGCCEVYGWLDSSTVLLASRAEQQRILAWNVASGGLSRVSDHPALTLSLGPIA